MSNPSRRRRGPTMTEVFLGDMHSLRHRLGRLIDRAVNWAFAFSAAGSQGRRYVLVGLALLVWLGMGLLLHPFTLGVDPLLDQLVYVLFAADVVRHMIVLLLAFFIGSRFSAVFVDDIFELKDVSVALHFLQTAAFSGRYEGMSIREAGVAGASQNSPIFRIGGPGVVDASLENAALFEKPNGQPHVVGLPNQRVAILEGFERLRAIIDLRDQFVDLTVEGRTQDGIPVVAKDVRLVYSIYRGPQADSGPDHFQQPYPFKEEAVLNLVYKQDKSPLLKAMVGSIRAELGAFISKHTLSEFLTNADDKNDFVSREQITELFYDYAKEFTQKAETRGVELKWIGVGTWMVPAQVIPGRQLDAWKLSAKARMNRNQYVLMRQRAESRITELLKLVDEVPSKYYALVGESLPPNQVAQKLLLDYREKLHNAYDLYLNNGESVPPELDLVIHHLTRLTAIRLGGQP